MKYVFVCTNYNNSHYSIKAVKSLALGDHPPALIVIVDNNSASDQQQALRQLNSEFDAVELVFSQENVGYFAGLNLGMRRARELQPDADCYIVGNNDLEFASDFGLALQRRAGTVAERMVVAPNILTVDGVRQNPHAIRPVSRLRELAFDFSASSYTLAKLIGWIAKATFRFTRRTDVDDHHSEGFIYMGLGACYILSRRFVERIGDLPAPTFLMYEEFFLSQRLAAEGEAVYYLPDLLVHHHDHGSVKLVPSRQMWDHWRASHRKYRKHIALLRRNPILDVLDRLQHGERAR